ncbi:putative signal peptide protein [Puccinia sorghi]|uniref:Putative signal peptide protein n=1 Tax=Puccinia sorghi TaxID=27349 RepID=A0A0L6V4H9_9BASI|nr:putative signal peptide protein [Puccinia sorghi]
MPSQFMRIYQITLLVVLLQLVAESTSFTCSDGKNTSGLCLMKRRKGVRIVNPSNDSGKLSCKNGQKEVCCPSGTQPSNFASEDAANAICKGKVTDPTTGGGGGTGTTAATGTGATAATGTGTTAATTTTGDKTGKDPKDPKSTEGKPTR